MLPSSVTKACPAAGLGVGRRSPVESSRIWPVIANRLDNSAQLSPVQSRLYVLPCAVVLHASGIWYWVRDAVPLTACFLPFIAVKAGLKACRQCLIFWRGGGQSGDGETK